MTETDESMSDNIKSFGETAPDLEEDKLLLTSKLSESKKKTINEHGEAFDECKFTEKRIKLK